MKTIKLNENQFNRLISNITKKVIKESEWDEYSWYEDDFMPGYAREDFYYSGCEEALEKRYPDMDFEFTIEDDGKVTALDLRSGKYYTGQGEIEYKIGGLGRPDSQDYDSEAEEEGAAFDYYNCLKTIMQKIDEDKPDGVDEDIVETSADEIQEAIAESVKMFVKNQKNR